MLYDNFWLAWTQENWLLVEHCEVSQSATEIWVTRQSLGYFETFKINTTNKDEYQAQILYVVLKTPLILVQYLKKFFFFFFTSQSSSFLVSLASYFSPALLLIPAIGRGLASSSAPSPCLLPSPRNLDCLALRMAFPLPMFPWTDAQTGSMHKKRRSGIN